MLSINFQLIASEEKNFLNGDGGEGAHKLLIAVKIFPAETSSLRLFLGVALVVKSKSSSLSLEIGVSIFELELPNPSSGMSSSWNEVDGSLRLLCVLQLTLINNGLK